MNFKIIADYLKSKGIWKYSWQYHMLDRTTNEETAKIMEKNALWYQQRTRPNYDYEHQCEIKMVDKRTMEDQ